MRTMLKMAQVERMQTLALSRILPNGIVTVTLPMSICHLRGLLWLRTVLFTMEQ